LVVDVPESVLSDVRTAVEDGGYESPQEFLETALRTQVELELGTDQDRVPSFERAVEGDGVDKTSSRPQQSVEDEAPREVEDLSVRAFDIQTVAPPAPDRIDTGPLWGQYNRIFPMKLAVRRLAVDLSESGSDWAPYGEFRDETATVAREYGLRLREVDEDRDRPRGEKLSAALPTGDSIERSLDGFKTHFVGQIDSDGDLTGALPTLRFVEVRPDPRAFGLTDAGVEFASIENPILDGGLQSEESLSEAEYRFYVDHVAEEHPAEYDAMRAVVEAVESGVDRPDSLSERVSELSDDWSSAQASTVRSGLVGRMYELGLVSRRRVGARGVGYDITDRGRQEFA
jgi:Arc/MetJ-type ribon-helix-helix transcriptional regulator